MRGECDNLAAENRKQENRISALMKLNKGQTYDILPEEGEAASRTAPSGAKYVSVDNVGGKSIVWNQLNNPKDNINVKKGAIKLNYDGSITISGTVQDAGKYNELQISQGLVFVRNQKYLVRTNKILSICVNGHDKSTTDALLYAGASDWTGFVALGVADGDEVNIEELVVQVYNLTKMFGAGNEPTIEQFKKLFVQKIYPYNPGEIISSRTETITAGAESITTGFPELRSALAAHDYIDMDGEKVHRKIKTVRIDGNTQIYGVSVDADANCCRIVFENALTPGIIGSKNERVKSNIISDRLTTISHADYWDNSLRASGINVYESLQAVCFRLHDRTDIDTKEKAKAWLAENPTTVFYEIESEEVTDVTIQEPLQEWLPVEAGGTVTFRNADESKQLAVPNAVSWVRKLNEVE